MCGGAPLASDWACPRAKYVTSQVTARYRGREDGRRRTSSRAMARTWRLSARWRSRSRSSTSSARTRRSSRCAARRAVRSSSSRLRSRSSRPRRCFALELAVGLVSAAAARALHLVFVAGLAAVIVLQALTKSDTLDGARRARRRGRLGAGGRAPLRADEGGADVPHVPRRRARSSSSRSSSSTRPSRSSSSRSRPRRRPSPSARARRSSSSSSTSSRPSR